MRAGGAHPRLHELLALLGSRHLLTFDAPKAGEHQIKYLTLMSGQGVMLHPEDRSAKYLIAYAKGDTEPKRFQASLDPQTGEIAVRRWQRVEQTFRSELGIVQWGMAVPAGYR